MKKKKTTTTMVVLRRTELRNGVRGKAVIKWKRRGIYSSKGHGDWLGFSGSETGE